MTRAQVNGIAIAYETYGEERAPAVVLIAGLGEQMGGTEFPAAFCEGLAARGYHVVRFDNRDAGRSTWLSEAGVPDFDALYAAALAGKQIPAPYTTADMADDVAGLLDALGIRAAHVMGASMGGYIARFVALRHPEKVDTLTLIMTGDGGAPSISEQAHAAMKGKATRVNREHAVEMYVTAWRRYNGPAFPFHEEWVRECGERTYDRGYNPEGVARHYAATLMAPRLEDAQRAINVPVLIIHGDADPIFDAGHARRVAHSIPCSDLMIIEGMGHEMPREAWGQMFDAFERLSRAAER